MRYRANIDVEPARLALRILGADALPQAVASTLNRVADLVHDDAIRNLRRRHTLRNTFSERSIRTSRSRPKRNIRAMYARVYSVSPYLHYTNAGGTISNRGAAIPVPTNQARTGRSYERSKRRIYRMRNLSGEIRSRSGSAFILGRGPERDYPAIFTRQGGRLRMLYRLDRKRMRVRGSGWWNHAMRFRNRAVMEQAFRREVERAIGRRLPRGAMGR